MTEPKIVVEYTPAEANAALQLYDVAVRARGMSVVEAAVHLSNKLTSAAAKVSQQLKTANGDASQPPPEPKSEPKKQVGKH